MFRDGHYLEVIKASDNCLATAVVTVQEKIIEIKKKKVSTNKWLDLEDWAALYKILEKAILRNIRAERSHENFEKCEWKKCTRQLQVTYTFEPSECPKDITSLPTIRVNVSPVRKSVEKLRLPEQPVKKGKAESHDRTCEKVQDETLDGMHKTETPTSLKKLVNKDGSAVISGEWKKDKRRRYLEPEDAEDNTLEEYVPDAPATKKLCGDLKYVPSRKSVLEALQMSSNEYTPTVSDAKSAAKAVRYIPNSVEAAKNSYDTYEPCAATSLNIPQEYVPNSKGAKASIEEYQPDFTSKSMKFDNSYIPSSVQYINENSSRPDESEKPHLQKHAIRRKATVKKGRPC